MSLKGIAALNVYKKVAIVRNATDTLTFEDETGNRQTISDFGNAASTSVRAISTCVLLQGDGCGCLISILSL